MKILRTCMLTMLCLALCGAMLVGYVAYLVPVAAAEVAQGDATVTPTGESVDPVGYLAASATYQNPAKMVADNISKDSVTLNLQGYTIVNDPSTMGKLRIQELSDRITAITGTKPAWSGRYSGTANKKLVVAVEDVLAKAALSQNPGKDFVIRVYGQNIVITGRNLAYAQLALDYFLENYLTEDCDVNITIPRLITGNLDTEPLVIGKRATKTETSDGTVTYGTDGTGVAWQIVYDNDLDHDGENPTNPPEGYGNSSSDTGNDDLYDEALKLQSWLNTTTGTNVYTLAADNAITQQSSLILIGNVNHSDVTTALSYIDETECIIAVINGNIVATGHTMEAQLAAAESLKDMLLQYVVYDGKVDNDNKWPGVTATSKTDEETGVTTTTTTYANEMIIPDNLCLITKAHKNWVGTSEGVVLPEGLTLTNVIDVNNGDLEYVYYNVSGESAYTTYCTELENAGFVSVASSSLSGSHFKTYVNYQSGVMLQVDYNAFAKTDEALGPNTPNASNSSNAAGDNFNEVVFAYASSTIRVTASNLLTSDLPDAALLNPEQSYVKKVDSTIVSIDLGADNYGTGYVMQLEDGRFVIVDGGKNDSTDIANLWSILSELHTDATGSEPSAANPVQIAAWIITHCHGDHRGMLQGFATSSYVTEKKVALQYLVYNFASRSEASGVGEHSAFSTTLSHSFSNYEVVKPVTGQTLYIANLKLETLFTHKDIYPQHTVAINDTSTIQRLTFVANSAASGTVTVNHLQVVDDNSSDSAYSFISTGDLYIQGSRWMCAMYGEDLRADMVSMAHHGGEGAESAFYDLVQPTIVWWSYPMDSIPLSRGGTPSVWSVNVNNYVAKTLSSVKYILFADDCNLSVTLTADTNLSDLGSKPTAVASTAPSNYYTNGITMWLYSKNHPAVKVR